MNLEVKRKLTTGLPGYLAISLLTLVTCLWTCWSVGEMYYEGWWGAWTNRIPYLLPMVICWIFTFLALTWPRLGGWIIFFVGGAFTTWRWVMQVQLGQFTLDWALRWFPISGIFILIALLFLLDGRFRHQARIAGWKSYQKWWRRSLGYLIVYGLSFLVAVGVTVHFVPLLSSRYDDGDLGERLIEGNGVTLVWAPAGPGWPQGIPATIENSDTFQWANLSWNEIAFYGISPVGIEEKPGFKAEDATEVDMQLTGLCRYLSGNGLSLMVVPQDIWRLPTTDEIVRSLVRRGGNAGCVWDGESNHADCEIQPNKDSPLWNPATSPIYYYSSEDYSDLAAWYVPYTGGGLFGGMIGSQSKNGGNSRHGYRCVREP
jgi:hypothetical protein